MLRDAGFDEPTARQLASRYSAEVIERQVEWLSLRQASRNRLGLLRRAIEGNWPPPQPCPAPAEEAHGALFVRHFEAALHRLPEVPAGCSPDEAKRAAAFLRELPGCPTSDEECVAWGQRFGRFVRGRSPHRPFFLWVIKVFREEFLRLVRDEIRAKSTTSKVRSREEHERRFNSRHMEYLRGVESDLREREPDLYREFCVHREQCVAELGLSDQSRAVLAGEVGRLTALAEFLRGRARPVLEFWEWDDRLNPDGWRRAQSGGD